jgi:hypothetical protein
MLVSALSKVLAASIQVVNCFSSENYLAQSRSGGDDWELTSFFDFCITSAPNESGTAAVPILNNEFTIHASSKIPILPLWTIFGVSRRSDPQAYASFNSGPISTCKNYIMNVVSPFNRNPRAARP